MQPRVPRDVLAVIAAGGMLGATARYALARWLPPQPGDVPWATFATNMAGSFALGLLLVVLVARCPSSRYARPFFATGVIGAFTTMSTYEVEVALLVDDGHPLVAIVYGLGSIVVGTAVAALGMLVARRALQRRRIA